MNDNIDPAIVEMACEAYRHPKRMLTNDSKTRHHDCMTAALEAAAPLIAAKALREAAEAMRSCKDPGHWNLRDLLDPEASYSPDVWLEVRADSLEAGQS